MTGHHTWALAGTLIAAVPACQRAADQSVSAARVVRAADSAWAQAFEQKDLAAYLTFVDSGATIQQPNGPPVTGTAAIRTLVEGFLALPALRGTWHPITAVASQSGDLAYTTGTYEFRYNDPTGKPATERGKYLEVWRRQGHGSWKMVVESFTSDLPLPAGPGS
jgi:ketosteroid isomerase-like protein